MNIIELENVSVRFSIPVETRKSVFENLAFLLTGRSSRREELRALQNVSLEVPGGEMLGIIGENGSGKTTLLRVIGGMIRPDSGRRLVEGSIAPFLGLGAGFQSELTVSDNIYLYGSIMGLSNRDIGRKASHILRFAELERFSRTQLKNLSSGMLMRLGFSVAVNSEADILLIDEVLAVGDEAFQRKCIEKMTEFKDGGRTIIFVSHNLELVRALCDQAILLHRGSLISRGLPQETVSEYFSRVVDRSPEREKAVPSETRGSGEVEIQNIRLFNDSGRESRIFHSGEKFIVRIDYHARRRVPDPVFGIAIFTENGVQVNGPNTKTDNFPLEQVEGPGQIEYAIESLPLLEGNYSISVSVHDSISKYHLFDHQGYTAPFRVIGRKGGKEGLVNIPGTWKRQTGPQS